MSLNSLAHLSCLPGEPPSLVSLSPSYLTHALHCDSTIGDHHPTLVSPLISTLHNLIPLEEMLNHPPLLYLSPSPLLPWFPLQLHSSPPLSPSLITRITHLIPSPRCTIKSEDHHNSSSSRLSPLPTPPHSALLPPLTYLSPPAPCAQGNATDLMRHVATLSASGFFRVNAVPLPASPPASADGIPIPAPPPSIPSASPRKGEGESEVEVGLSEADTRPTPVCGDKDSLDGMQVSAA